MANKIVVTLDGHVEQIGTPLEVYDHPDSQFVAGFIGSPAMNFLSGRIETSGGASVVTKDGARNPASGLSRISDGQEVTLGIRPEHLEVVPPETAGAFSAEFLVVEPTGSETMISTNVTGAQMVAVLRSRHRFQAGERIGLRPEPGRVTLFDPTTERGLRIE
jgi:multiple sugar transport system ATP-binding protein